MFLTFNSTSDSCYYSYHPFRHMKDANESFCIALTHQPYLRVSLRLYAKETLPVGLTAITAIVHEPLNRLLLPEFPSRIYFFLSITLT